MRVAGTRGKRRVVSLLLVLLLAHLLLLLLLLLLLRRDQPAPPAAAAAAGDASAAPPALPHTRFLGSPSRQESPCVGVGGGRPSAWQPVYTVVIDAGATATRAHVFSFLRCCIDNTFLLQKEDYFHVDDSILHYVNAPHQIRGLLMPLLRQAREVVPEEYLKHTPLILRATPSLRRLPRTHATRLIHRARNVASRTAFLVRRDHVTIMAGHDEAADLWLAANFLTGRLYRNTSYPLATADLGGGTLQVTVPLPGPPEHIRKAIERRKQQGQREGAKAGNETDGGDRSSGARHDSDDTSDVNNNSYQKNPDRRRGGGVASGVAESGNRDGSENRSRKSEKRRGNNSDDSGDSEGRSEGSGHRVAHAGASTNRREEERRHRGSVVNEKDITKDDQREIQVSFEVSSQEAVRRVANPSTSGTKVHQDERIRHGGGAATEGNSDGFHSNGDRPRRNGTAAGKHLVDSSSLVPQNTRGRGRKDRIRGESKRSEADTRDFLDVAEDDTLGRLTPDLPGAGRDPEDDEAKDDEEEQEESPREDARREEHEMKRGKGKGQERIRRPEHHKKGTAETRRQQEKQSGNTADRRKGSEGRQRKKSSSSRQAPPETSTEINQGETSTEGSMVATEDTGATESSYSPVDSNNHHNGSSTLRPMLRRPSSHTQRLRPIIQKRKRRKQRRRQRKRNQKKPTRRKDVDNATGLSHSAESELKDLTDLDTDQSPITTFATPRTIQEVLSTNPQSAGSGSGEGDHRSHPVTATQSTETLVSRQEKGLRKDFLQPSLATIQNGDLPAEKEEDNRDHKHSQRTLEESPRIRGEDNGGNHHKKGPGGGGRGGKSQTENMAASEIESTTSKPSGESEGNEVIIKEIPPTSDKASGSGSVDAYVSGHERARSRGKEMELNRKSVAAQEQTEGDIASVVPARREQGGTGDQRQMRKPVERIRGSEERRIIGTRRRFRPANSRWRRRKQRLEGNPTQRRGGKRLQGFEPSAAFNSTRIRAHYASTKPITETVAMQKRTDGMRHRPVSRRGRGRNKSRGPDADDDSVSRMNNRQNPHKVTPTHIGNRARPARGSKASEFMADKNQSISNLRKDRKRQSEINSQIQPPVGRRGSVPPWKPSTHATAGDKERTDGVKNPDKKSEYPGRTNILPPSPRQRHHRRPRRRRKEEEGRKRRDSVRAEQQVLHGPHRFPSSREDKGSAVRRKEDQRNREELAVPFSAPGEWREPTRGSYFVGWLPRPPGLARRRYKVARDLKRSLEGRHRDSKVNTRLRKHTLTRRNKCKTKEESRNKSSRRSRDSRGWRDVSRPARKTKDDLRSKRRKFLSLTQRHPRIERELRTSDERRMNCHRTKRQSRKLERNKSNCYHHGSYANRTIPAAVAWMEPLVVRIENLTDFQRQENETVLVNIPASAEADQAADQRTRRELRNLFDAPNITYRCSPSHKYWLFASSVPMGIYPARVKVLQAGNIIRLPATPGEPAGAGGSDSASHSPSTPATPRHRSDIPPEEEYTEMGEGGDDDGSQPQLPSTSRRRPVAPSPSSSSSPSSIPRPPTSFPSSSSSSPPPLPPFPRPPHTQVITNKWMEETLAKVKTVVDSILRSIGSARDEQERKRKERLGIIDAGGQGEDGEKEEASKEGGGRESGRRRKIPGRTGSRRRKTGPVDRGGEGDGGVSDGGTEERGSPMGRDDTGRHGDARRGRDPTAEDGGRERQPTDSDERGAEGGSSSRRKDKSGAHYNEEEEEEEEEPEISPSYEGVGATVNPPDSETTQRQSSGEIDRIRSSGVVTEAAPDGGSVSKSGTDSRLVSVSKSESDSVSGSESDSVSMSESDSVSRYESDSVSRSEDDSVPIYSDDIESSVDSISRTAVQSASLAENEVNLTYDKTVSSRAHGGEVPDDTTAFSPNSEIALSVDSEQNLRASDETTTSSSYSDTVSKPDSEGPLSPTVTRRSSLVPDEGDTHAGTTDASATSGNAMDTTQHRTPPPGIDVVLHHNKSASVSTSAPASSPSSSSSSAAAAAVVVEPGNASQTGNTAANSSKQTISSVTDLLFTVPNERVIKPAENSEVKSEIKSTEELVRTSLEDLLFRVPGESSSSSGRQPHEDRGTEAGPSSADVGRTPNATTVPPPSGVSTTQEQSRPDDSVAGVTTEVYDHSNDTVSEKTSKSEQANGSSTVTDPATGSTAYPREDIENGLATFITENEKMWGNSFGQQGDMILRTTCLPVGSIGRFQVENVTYLVVGVGAGKGAQDCWREVTSLVNKHIRLPPLNHTTLLATTAFYFVAASANLIEPDMDYGFVRVGQFRVAANIMCAREPRLLPDPLACLDYQYVAALLTHGLHLADDTEILVCEKIQGFRLGWALGAALDYLQNH